MIVYEDVNMIERTLVLIKPDGVYRALIGKVIQRFEDAGLKVVGMKMVWPSKDMASEHYVADEKWLLNVGTNAKKSYIEKGMDVNESELEIGNKVRNYLLDYITSGPIAALVIEGNDAVSIVRKIGGSTSPQKADPSSIRGMYSSDSYQMADEGKRAVKNILHMSEDPVIAKREIKVWFSEAELVDYKRADEKIQYGT